AKNDRARFFLQSISFFAVFFEQGRERDLAIEPRAHLSRLGYVDHPDGPTLQSVAVQQARPSPALEHRRQFPADIYRVANSGIHAEAASGPWTIRRVTDENDTPVHITLRNRPVARIW